MYFLIDYENVNYAGLEGSEFITKDDKVVIFYSDCCKYIPYYRFSEMINSGCEIDTCRLVNTGRNALDFYIASKVGEIMSSDQEAVVAIISHDKGYKAVKDYWMKRLNPTSRLVVSSSIAAGIISSSEKQERKKTIQDSMKKVGIQEAFDEYTRIVKIRKCLMEVFEGSIHEKVVPQILDIILSNSNAKGRYLDTLKIFGKKDGLIIYHQINNCLTAI